MTSAWLILFFAGLLEVCWAIGLKYSEGFSRVGPSIFTLITLVASMYLLAKATQTIPLGTAYAVWVGIGTIGAVVFGVLFFKEPINFSRIFFLALLLISILGLKMSAQ